MKNADDTPLLGSWGTRSGRDSSDRHSELILGDGGSNMGLDCNGPIVVGPATLITPKDGMSMIPGKNGSIQQGDNVKDDIQEFHGSQDCFLGAGNVCCRFGICPKRNSTRWMSCCGVAACITLILAFVLPVIIDGIIEDEVNAAVIVSSTRDSGYEEFASDAESSIELFEKVYFFNVENEAAVLAGEKPVLVERGPYVWRRYLDRFAGVPGAYTGPEFVNGGKDVQFYFLLRWEFQPEMSCPGCSEDDSILGPDWVLNGFRYYITYLQSLIPEDTSPTIKGAIDSVLDGVIKAVMCSAQSYKHPVTGEDLYSGPTTPFWRRPVTDILFGFNYAPHLNVTNKLFAVLEDRGIDLGLFLSERNPGPKQRHRCDNYPGNAGDDWIESGYQQTSSTCFDDAFTQSGMFRTKTGKNSGSEQGTYVTWPGGEQTRICTKPSDCVLCEQLDNMGRFDDGAQRLLCPDFQAEWENLPITGPRIYRFPWSDADGVLQEGETIEEECPEDSLTCFTLEDFAGYTQPYVTGTGDDSTAALIFGTDGKKAGRNFDATDFFVFNQELPGVLQLTKDPDPETREGELKNIPYTRYKFAPEQYEPCTEESSPGSIQCQRGNTGPYGVINGDLPNEIYLFLSQPHFLNADPSYVESLVGMNPLEAAHATRVDINGFTGQAIRGKQATQLGIKMFNFDLPAPPEAGVVGCIVENECLAGVRDIDPEQIENKEGLGLCFLDPENGCISFDENGDIDIVAALNCVVDDCSDYVSSPGFFLACGLQAIANEDPLPALLGCVTQYGVFLPGVTEALQCIATPAGPCTESLQETLALEDPLADIVKDIAQALTVNLPSLIGLEVSEEWMSECVAWDGQWDIKSATTDLVLGEALYVPAFWDDYEVVLPDDLADDLNELYDYFQLRDDVQLSLLVVTGGFGFSLLTMLWLHRLNLQESGKVPVTGWCTPAAAQNDAHSF